MFNFIKKKKEDVLKNLLKDIHLVENQVELIDMIRKGKLKMIYKGKTLSISITKIAYYKELWVSPCKRIKFWHEDPGFISFSYLTINNNKDLIDELIYGREIALTIQDPKHNYIINSIRI